MAASKYPKTVVCPITGIVAVVRNAEQEAQWHSTTKIGVIAAIISLILVIASVEAFVW
jgi:hypothetical protein